MIATSARLAFGYASMFVHAVSQPGLLARRAVRDSLARQIYVTGVQAMPYVTIVALLFAVFVVSNVLSLLGPDNEIARKAVVWGGIRELGPLVTAMIIIVRSSVAIAAEVALMRVRSHISDEAAHGLEHEEEVVLPRVLGGALSGAMLAAVFQVLAFAAGIGAIAFGEDTSPLWEIETFLESAVWWQVPLSVGKGALFGMGITAISTYHGLHVEPKVAKFPKAVSAACAGSVVFVMIVDTLAAALLLLA